MTAVRFGYTPTHPGEVLKDEIEYRGISQRQLAEQMNFSSQSAFCNAFKRILGEPPSKYQRSGQ